jgi:hypothetical protein
MGRYNPSDSFTKLAYVFDMSLGKFLLHNTNNFVIWNISFYFWRSSQEYTGRCWKKIFFKNYLKCVILITKFLQKNFYKRGTWFLLQFQVLSNWCTLKLVQCISVDILPFCLFYFSMLCPYILHEEWLFTIPLHQLMLGKYHMASLSFWVLQTYKWFSLKLYNVFLDGWVGGWVGGP